MVLAWEYGGSRHPRARFQMAMELVAMIVVGQEESNLWAAKSPYGFEVPQPEPPGVSPPQAGSSHRLLSRKRGKLPGGRRELDKEIG